jgi:hypothetical protein
VLGCAEALIVSSASTCVALKRLKASTLMAGEIDETIAPAAKLLPWIMTIT